ncbi:MAG: DUF2806 domain-containing protein [Treponema sp.]|nr:DUF2806 domain-containing protein [Treponema sp.]
MDNFSLIESVKNGISIFQPTLQTIVGVIMSTLFLRGNKDTEELSKIKNKKFGEVAVSLLESGKMSYLEFYKCRNFLKVAKLADDRIKHKTNNEKIDQSENTLFDFDWFMRFFDSVGNISNENLQNLWAEILAGEVQKPNSCSLRTLDIIRNMNQNEAKIYTELCKYVLSSHDSYFILSSGFIDHDGFPDEEELNKECFEFIFNMNLNYSKHILPMLECGLLTSDNNLTVNITGEVEVDMHNDKICCYIKLSNSAMENTYFNEDVLFLTTNGIELFNIIRKAEHFVYDVEYATRCFNRIKNKYANMNLAVEAYYLENIEGILRYNSDNILLQTI